MCGWIERKPDFMVGYSIQSIRGGQIVNDELIDYNTIPRFHGLHLGVSLPIFGKGYKAQAKVSGTTALIHEAAANQLRVEIQTKLTSIIKLYEIQREEIEYYKLSALPNALLISSSAKEAYERGEIGYTEYVQALSTQFELQQEYLDAVLAYNQSVLTLQYLLNQ